jgi:hypothetical protein
MQMLRQAGYGGRAVPVNPKGGTIFGYESVTTIGAMNRWSISPSSSSDPTPFSPP